MGSLKKRVLLTVPLFYCQPERVSPCEAGSNSDFFHPTRMNVVWVPWRLVISQAHDLDAVKCSW
jgi:hypothetical protein